MTGRKNRVLQVPPVVLYKALEKFSKALYGTTEGTCSAQFFRPVMTLSSRPPGLPCKHMFLSDSEVSQKINGRGSHRLEDK